MNPAQRIPVTAAKRIADEFGQQQVIVVTWEATSGTIHVVTYGTTLLACDQAAQGGNRVKAALGWPEHLCQDKPSRARRKGAAA